MPSPRFEKRSKILRKKAVIAAAGLALVTLSCAGSQSLDKRINERWQWDGGVEASRVVERVNARTGPARLSAVVGVTGFGVRGQVLPEGKVWNFEAPVDVLPSIAGDTVLFTGEGQLYALDLRSGAKLFQAAVSGRRLEGVGSDGNCFLVLLVDADDAREDEIRMFTRDGVELSSVSVTARLGTPAVVDGIGLIPYDGQYVAGFDIASKNWLGRVLYRDALHTVTADDRGVLLWGNGVTRLDTRLTSSPDSQALLLPLGEFPGSPSWPVDGSKPRPARAQAINIFATPEVKDTPAQFAHGLYVATYYQIALGLEPGTGKLRWVNHLPRSIIGGAIAETNVTVCLEDGSVSRLDLKEGGLSPLGSLDARLKACVVSAANEPARVSDDQRTLARPELEEQIVETIASTGPDMAKVQILLLDRMATRSGAATTRALLQLAQDPMVSSELAQHAGRLIAKRTSGGEEMVRALNEFSEKRAERLRLAAQSSETSQKSADQATALASNSDNSWQDKKQEEEPAPSVSMAVARFSARVDDEPASKRALRPPPVAAIAQALIKIKTPGSAAALAKYLDDPALNATQLKVVMNAVSKLGGPDEVERVHAFLRNYKNTGGEPHLIDALVQAVEFLLAHLTEPQKSEMKEEVNESLTHPEVRRRAQLIQVPRNSADTTEPDGTNPPATSEAESLRALPKSGAKPSAENQP